MKLRSKQIAHWDRSGFRFQAEAKVALLAALAGLVCYLLCESAHSQVTVDTIAGGRVSAAGPDFGHVNGDSLQASQFHSPSGCAVDKAGILYVADTGNGAVRKIDVPANRSSTLISGLKEPVAVVAGAGGDLHVLTRGDGSVWKFDSFGSLSLEHGGFDRPSAFGFDGAGTLYVAAESGEVLRLRPGSKQAELIATGMGRPGGVLALSSGLVAVSDSAGHVIRLIHAETGAVINQIGSGAAGFRDGPTGQAQFNEPRNLALLPDGSFAAADSKNHRLRVISTEGIVRTVYGIDPANWEGPECIGCSPMILPGWLDGRVEFAEARLPIGVAVAPSGRIYTTEGHYHIIRSIDGAVSAGSGGGGISGAAIEVQPPVFSPEEGYFPLGQKILVTNLNSSSFFNPRIFYTVDGSAPDTNSHQVYLTNDVGTIFWKETERDLTFLRLRAFLGTNGSRTVSGKAARRSTIGVTRDLFAGPGSTLVVPVVAHLRTNDTIQSIQFRAEVSPATAGAPMISDAMKPLSYAVSDFVGVVTSSDSEGESEFTALPYSFGQTRGWALAFIGTNANYSIRSHAVVALLSIPIPKAAPIGSRYQFDIVAPSATKNGLEESIMLEPMPARTITIANVGYVVGDSAPGNWYNASGIEGLGFGDGALSNADVNNVFGAILGERTPYLGTDLYNSMDAFPVDSRGGGGGDGLLRYLDWQIIFLRSLGLDPAKWRRYWAAGGVLAAEDLSASTQSLFNLPGEESPGFLPGWVWFREASLSAGTLEQAQPGVAVDVPVTVEVARGYRLAGMAFKAVVRAEGGAPELEQAARFIPSEGVTGPALNSNPRLNAVLCGWPLVPTPAWEPPLEGTKVIGHLRIAVPASAKRGQQYVIEFSNADGSPNLETQYNFETRSGALWVAGPAGRAPEPFSVEWKNKFLGHLPWEEAAPDADPDGDGLSNAAEYQAGTNPISGSSKLALEGPVNDPSKDGVVFRWLTAPGKTYSLEACPDTGGEWSTIARDIAGDGGYQEWIHGKPDSGLRLFRVRLQP